MRPRLPAPEPALPRLRRLLFGLLLLALVLAPLATLVPPAAPEARVAAASAAVVRLEHPDGHGSGVVVRCEPARWGRVGYDVWVLTAEHVAAHGELTSPSGLRWGWPVASHPELDLAIVCMLSDVPVPVARCRAEPLALAERVWSVGFGGGQGMWISAGNVSGEDRASAPVAPGDSGGAILDADGYLVGTVVAVELIRYPWGPDLTLHHTRFVPTSQVLGWAQDEAGIPG